MAVLRGLWWALAALAAALMLSAGNSSIMSASLSCAKVGEIYNDDAPAHLQCNDPLIEWVGVWPFVWLGLLLVTPPVVAALVMRLWVSWMAVAALGVLSIVGLINWTGIVWGRLLYAVPLAIAALVIATVQYARTPPPVAVALWPRDCAHRDRPA